MPAAASASLTSCISAATTILIGISSDDDGDCSHRDLLSWVVTVLARPLDTVVALHILGEAPKKLMPRTREYKRLRRSKAFALSAVGEFANICQSNKVHLEARVKYSSSVRKGLVEEAKAISAQFLILGSGGVRYNVKRSNRQSHQVTNYCLKNAPKFCSVFSIPAGKHGWPKEIIHDLDDDFMSSFHEIFSVSNHHRSMEKINSPRTVLHRHNHHYGSESDSPKKSNDSITISSSSFSDDMTTVVSETSSPSPSHRLLVSHKPPQSPLKRVSSFLRRSFHSISSTRKITSLVEEEQQQSPLLRCFSYQEISKATNNFHPDKEVGRGGYSEVYRGDLDCSIGRRRSQNNNNNNNSNNNTIAVKRLAKEDNTNLRKEKEFLIELGIIGHVSHPNTASLMGYCIEKGLYLIFEFSPNGNLSEALHGNEWYLEWAMRYKIVLGIARGLHYLHKCCKHRIIHRDIKASNVLLGPDYEPKISDFGLAKWLPSKSNHHAVAPTIEGTFGYLAPEYFMHGMVDEKTDVYALGVLLLEILTGRRPVDPSSNSNLLLWARPLIESDKIEDLVDPRLGGALNYDSDQVNRVVLTASYCVQQSASLRPSMTEVLDLLYKGHDADMAKARAQNHQTKRMPSMSSDEMDDFSMAFGYSIPIDFDLDEDDDW